MMLRKASEHLTNASQCTHTHLTGALHADLALGLAQLLSLEYRQGLTCWLLQIAV